MPVLALLLLKHTLQGILSKSPSNPDKASDIRLPSFFSCRASRLNKTVTVIQ
jgi:hypothetical protein